MIVVGCSVAEEDGCRGLRYGIRHRPPRPGCEAQMTGDMPEQQIHVVVRDEFNIGADAKGSLLKLIHLLHGMPVSKPQGSYAVHSVDACKHV